MLCVALFDESMLLMPSRKATIDLKRFQCITRHKVLCKTRTRVWRCEVDHCVHLNEVLLAFHPQISSDVSARDNVKSSMSNEKFCSF